MLLVAVRLFIAWTKAAWGLLNVCLSRHSEAASAWFRKQCLPPHPAKGATESIRWKNLWNYTTQQNSTASKQCQRKQFSILRHSLQHYPFASYLPHFGHHPQARKSKYFHFINKQSMIINIKMRKTTCFCRRKKIKIFWIWFKIEAGLSLTHILSANEFPQTKGILWLVHTIKPLIYVSNTAGNSISIAAS